MDHVSRGERHHRHQQQEQNTASQLTTNEQIKTVV